MNAAFAGTGGLIRLVLRRDRVLLPIWVLLLAVLPATYAGAFAELYPTAAERQAYATGLASSPSIVALLGPVHGNSLGALTVQRSSLLLLFVALISLLTVVRHTRTEEEAGRRELLGATVLGRHAGLAAALLVTYAANLLLGLLTAAGLVNAGLPVGGALAFGLATTGTGMVFATVGAVVAQLTEGAGAARGIGLAVLGAAFLARMAGDVAEVTWLSWLSPLAWGERIRAFDGERWWVLLLDLVLSALLAALAYRLSAGRDLGAGLLPARLGPADASPNLRGPTALAWRLHRGPLLGWSVGFLALGLVLGGVAEAAGEAAAENAQLAEIIMRLGGAAGIADAYLAGTIALVALAAAGYAVQAALRLRGEEVALRSEPLLAASVSRSHWAAGHLVFALLGPAVLLAAVGSGAGVAYGLSTGEVGRQLLRLTAAALVQLPAVWVLAGVTVLLFGLLPRLTAISWAVLAICVLLGQLGAVLELSQWALDLSPFTHTPRLPGSEVAVTPLMLLSVIAAVLTGIGLAGFRRRDVPLP